MRYLAHFSNITSVPQAIVACVFFLCVAWVVVTFIKGLLSE